MKLLSAGLMAALAASALPARAAPAQVIIIRHGEKPDTGPDLDAQGYQRAAALVGFFESNPAVTRYGPPVAIYAMDPKDEDGSMRPIETVTPLADALKLTIDHDYLKDQLPQLVSDIMADKDYDGKMVLVCWEHKVIPDLVRDFGWESPPKWPGGSVFDQAWILDFDASGTVSSFQVVPEHVLPGDSD
ncbi:MAG TPA: histidine phosphatase family protein [Elusimicrobiota bacterium]|nr:histidine phosphatase family protein [Elusimicrobiota bacterium]